MKAVKENEVELKTDETPKARVIVIVGVDNVSKQFLLEAICRIISMSGMTVNATPISDLNGEEVKEQFHVLVGGDFDPDLEIKSRLIFASFRKPEEVISELSPSLLMVSDEYKVALNRFYELTKWMRSGKLAYTIDYNHNSNDNGLHNYTTLRNIILPMNYAFQRDTIDELPLKEDFSNAMVFNKINPQKLIEALVPELKKKSEEASKIFDETLKEKLPTNKPTDENI